MATNDFKVFAGGGGANVLTQQQYLALTTLLSSGFQTGIAQSNQVNKVLRQPSIIAAMIAQFIVDQTGQNAVDDGTIATLEQNFIAALMATQRIKLSAPANLYVATSGSDSNSGMSASTPFQTLQKAASVAQNNYDTQGFTITINVAAGTYTTGASLSAQPLGGGQVKFLGNTVTPSSVSVTLSSAGTCFSASNGARMVVSGIALSAPTGSSNVGNTAGVCISASTGASVTIDHVSFGTTQQWQVTSASGGAITATGPYSITGGAQNHLVSAGFGTIVLALQAVTITGTPNFSNAFAWADLGYIYAPQATFSGSATGTRYLINEGGVIQTAGGGANFFPGSVAGNLVGGYYG